MADNSSISIAVLGQLRRFDTPTVCNVVELFDLRPRTAGYMDARIRALQRVDPRDIGREA